MAMTLRLSDEDVEALRGRAEAEGRSMQEVVRSAVPVDDFRPIPSGTWEGEEQ